MFEPHFGLRENPFSTGHDPRFVYPSPEHLEAVAHFRYGIQNREAFVLVTGEVGTGKTTAIYDLISRLPQQTHLALINNSALTRVELLEEIARRFGLEPPSPPSKPSLLSALELRLSGHVGHGEPCILIVDEAQNLSHDLLEEIRLLSNLEDRGGHLLHICLVGQPELEEKLARPELRQLRQRISVKYRLKPLDAEECVRYIHHRLRVAGGESEAIFPLDSCYAVHRMTHGIPREINIVASQAMVNAYVEGARPVAPEHVRAVSEEFHFQSVLEPRDVPLPTEPHPQPAPAPPLPRVGAPPAPTRMPTPHYASPVVPPRSATPLPAAPQPSAPMMTPSSVASRPPIAAASAVSGATPPAIPSAPPAPPPPSLVATPTPAATVRTVGNWRERRPAPVALQQPAAVADELDDEPFQPQAPGRDAEDVRAQRTRMIALAAVVAGLVIGGAVIYSTGLLDRRGSGAATTTPSADAPAANSPSDPARGSNSPGNGHPAGGATAKQPATAHVAAPSGETAASGALAYGLQVASFRTAGRAARVLRDLETTTGLPGEVLTNEIENETWYRIVVGRFADEAAARQNADDLLQRSLIAEAIVIPYRPQAR